MANFDLSKLMEGKNPQAVMLAETRQLKTKWEKTGLLEGMKERDQHSMAVLLENQAKQLLDEATQTGTSSGSEEWSGVALPLVRRIFGEIAAKEFVSVQPMNLPSGLIFFLDFKYGTAQAGNPAFNGKSLFGGTGTTFGRTDSAVNGLYGQGRYGYSVNDVVSSSLATTTAPVSASFNEIGYDTFISASAADNIVKLVFPTSSFANADFTAVSSFVLSHATAFTQYNHLTKLNGGNVEFFVERTANAVTSSIGYSVAHSVQPSDFNRGDFEDKNPIEGPSSGTNIDIPEIDLELKSEAIVAKTRKLKAVWTPELAQDLNAYHSIDAEAELTSMLSDYISLEIDLEILDMLKSNALTTEYWSTNVGEELVNGAWSNIGGASNAYTKNAWYQTLGIKLNKVSNKIHQLTLRGGANFVVASPDVCTILESIPGFVVNADKDAMQFAAGVTAVGSMSNRYTVYKNPYMTSNEILMGYRGNNFLETGAVYAPYVPLIMTPLVYDPQNFTPRRGVMTRYAKKMVRPEYYGKIYIKDLASI
jgi:flagellin-like hook-associated protein FlgL